jgi:hypothetical protein
VKLIIKQGKVLVSAARRLLSIGTADCPCCGPTGPLYMRFNPCGYPGGTPVWVRTDLLDPTTGAYLLRASPDGPLRCYCGSGVIKPLSEIPAGHYVSPIGGGVGYNDCCQCFFANSNGENPCQSIPQYTPTGQPDGVCCCSPVSGGSVTDRWAVIGTTRVTSYFQYRDFDGGPIYSSTLEIYETYNGSSGVYREVYTNTGYTDVNYDRTNPVPIRGLLGNGCGKQALASAATQAAANSYSPIQGENVFGTLTTSVSSTCTTGTYTATYINDQTEFGFRYYTYLTHQYTVIAKQTGAICDCYGASVPGIEAVNAGNPLDFLPEP